MTDKRKKSKLDLKKKRKLIFTITESHSTAHPSARAQPCISSQDRFLSLEIMRPGVYLVRPSFVRKKVESISYRTPGNQLHRAVRKSLLIVEAEKENSYQVDVI